MSDLSWYDPAENDHAQVGDLHYAAKGSSFGSVDRYVFIRESGADPSGWKVVGMAMNQHDAATTWLGLVVGQQSDRRIGTYVRSVETPA